MVSLKERLDFVEIDSPVGPLRLASDDRALRFLSFMGGRDPVEVGSDWRKRRAPILRAAASQLREYFDGRRTEFDLPLDPHGTDFQRAVWDALCEIPFGETRSYGEQARMIGRPNASRAVGAANGRNPIAIIIPCHRVIGASGELTGFGGGLDTKRRLLDLERGVLAAV